MKKADAARELLARRKARASLHDFIVYLHDDYITSDFSRSVCSALETFYEEVKQGIRPCLILSAPPQHGKTEIVSRYLPAWLFGLNPHLSIGGLSYGKDLATDNNRDLQRIMISEEYGRLFPASCLNQKRNVVSEVEAKRNSDSFDIVGHRGKYIAQGVGGPLTGRRLDVGIIDDPIKNSKEALSVTTKESIWNWYTTTFKTRLSMNSGQIIMATRWASDDLSGRIEKKTNDVTIITFPAISNDNKALVSGLHPVGKLLEMKSTMSEFFWSAMYQQNPIPLGGNLFKIESWKYYQELPKLKYRIIFADTAQKTKEQNDYSVFQCWGETYEGQAVFVDQIRGKWEAPELLINARAFYAKHKAINNGSLRSVNIEDKSSGTGLIQTLKREGMPIVAIQRSVDKITRALDVIPFVDSGNVLLPENSPWLSDYLLELSGFPNSSHDDQVDPTIDAIKHILQIGYIDYSKLC